MPLTTCKNSTHAHNHTIQVFGRRLVRRAKSTTLIVELQWSWLAAALSQAASEAVSQVSWHECSKEAHSLGLVHFEWPMGESRRATKNRDEKCQLKRKQQVARNRGKSPASYRAHWLAIWTLRRTEFGISNERSGENHHHLQRSAATALCILVVSSKITSRVNTLARCTGALGRKSNNTRTSK